ncbi:hypothetical protein BsWGS_11470 [Bradybaena similaris]
MEKVSFLMIFIAVRLATAQPSYLDHCYLVPQMTTSKVIDLEIPQHCTAGTVDWNYPKGTIDLHLVRPGGHYLLCLETSWSTMLGGLKKVVNGTETELPVPTKDSASCTEDVDGKTRLLVTAPSDLLYMTEFNYRVTAPLAS